MKNIEALKSLIENNKAELEKLETLLAEAIEENKKEEMQELTEYAQIVNLIVDWMVE